MTALRYNTADLQAWAEFSGDFNPVHFDLARAARLNLGAVPVHGMRVMLDVKAALFQEAGRREWPEGALVFKAVLRAPVLNNASYRFAIESRGNGLNFAVADEARNTPCMTGHLRPLSVSVESKCDPAGACGGGPAWHSFSISKAERAAAIALWPATSHGQAGAWLLLDALLFSALLRQPGLFAQVSDFAGFAPARSVDDLMQHATVLQTHHSTVISAEIQRMDIDSTGAYGEGDAIRCDIDTPVITGSGQEGCVIQATLSAYADTQFLLRTTVALMISPLSSSAKQLEQQENV